MTQLGFVDEKVASVDTTDGLRVTLQNNDIIHLRPSGNAPELRCYAESSSETVANGYVTQALNQVISL